MAHKDSARSEKSKHHTPAQNVVSVYIATICHILVHVNVLVYHYAEHGDGHVSIHFIAGSSQRE